MICGTLNIFLPLHPLRRATYTDIVFRANGFDRVVSIVMPPVLPDHYSETQLLGSLFLALYTSHLASYMSVTPESKTFCRLRQQEVVRVGVRDDEKPYHFEVCFEHPDPVQKHAWSSLGIW
jgi:hypothetical protein